MLTRKEYNQKMIDYGLGVNHVKCMDHCLDLDRDFPGSAYQVHSSIRRLWILECQTSARDANREHYEATKYNVPVSLLMRRKRERGLI